MTGQNRPRRFEGRVAIVTGSSRGIGRATAEQLAAEGAAVVCNARHQGDVEEAAESIRRRGGIAVGVAADLGDDDAPSRLVASAVDEFGGIDLLVNNVGVNRLYAPLLASNRRAFESTMLMNTWPWLAMVQAAMASGLAHRGGAVVNVSTTGARQVQPLVSVYSAAKAALELLTRTLARELGPSGVRVNAVAPGLVRTQLTEILREGGKEEAESALLPLQRIGAPEDIAPAIAFLLSDEASWITGAVLIADGGRLTVGDEPRDLYGVYGKVSS